MKNLYGATKLKAILMPQRKSLTYPKTVSESGRFLVNTGNVDAEAILDASTNHEAKIVIHNQLKGYLNAESQEKNI